MKSLEVPCSCYIMLYTRLDLCCANAMKSSRFLERNSRNAKVFGTSTSLEHKNGTSCLPPGAHFGQEVDILGEYAIRVHASQTSMANLSAFGLFSCSGLFLAGLDFGLGQLRYACHAIPPAAPEVSRPHVLPRHGVARSAS